MDFFPIFHYVIMIRSLKFVSNTNSNNNGFNIMLNNFTIVEFVLSLENEKYIKYLTVTTPAKP